MLQNDIQSFHKVYSFNEQLKIHKIWIIGEMTDSKGKKSSGDKPQDFMTILLP